MRPGSHIWPSKWRWVIGRYFRRSVPSLGGPVIYCGSVTAGAVMERYTFDRMANETYWNHRPFGDWDLARTIHVVVRRSSKPDGGTSQYHRIGRDR